MKKCLKSQVRNKHDILYTPPQIAKLMIDMCDIRDNDVLLDPCRGGSVFYNNFPTYTYNNWCEIDEGVDFFKCYDKFDWVIGNPPYSLWNKWIEHTMNITDNFCYIFSYMNFTPTRVARIKERGFTLTKMHLLKVDWWMSQSIICVFQRGESNVNCEFTVSDKTFQCPDCNTRCGRGRCGKDYNVCGL